MAQHRNSLKMLKRPVTHHFLDTLDFSRMAGRFHILPHRFAKSRGFFHTFTPTSELGQMNIGSRPAKRRNYGGIDTLRAIPWIFAWHLGAKVLGGCCAHA